MDEFDDWDDPIDDLDFDWDFDGPKESKVKSFLRGFVGGAKESLFSKETLQLALPSSFKNTFQSFSDLSYKRREIEEEFKKANAQSMQDLQYIVGKGIAKFKDKLPNKIVNGVDKFTDRDFSRWEESGYGESLDTVGSVDNDEISSNIDQTTASIEEQTGVIVAVGETIADTMGKVSANTNAHLRIGNKHLLNINHNLTSILAYQQKVQARNDAVKIRLLSSMNLLNAKYYKFMEASMHKAIAELKDIKVNSGKSEIEKTNTSDYLKNQIRNSIFSTVTNKVGGIGEYFKDKFGKDTRNSKYDDVGGLLSSIRMGMEMSEGMPVNHAEIVGQMVGQFLIGQAPYMLQSEGAQKIINRVKKAFPEQDKYLTDIYKSLTKLGNVTSYGLNNYKGILNSQIGQFAFDEEEDMTYEDYVALVPPGKRTLTKAEFYAKRKAKTLTNKALAKMLEDSTDSLGSRVSVQARSLKDLTTPTTWNNLDRRTLTEVIPALISQVHLSLEKIRTGNDNLKPISYSFQRGKLVNANENTKAVKEALFNKREFNNQADGVLGLVNEIDKEGVLSNEAKKQLALRLAKDSDSDTFNPYMLADFQADGVDSKVANEISTLIKARFGITDEDLEEANSGSYVDRIIRQTKFSSSEGQELANKLAERMNNLKNWKPDISERLDTLRLTGQEQELIRLGLLRYENGNLYFNDKAVDDFLASSIDNRLNSDSEYMLMYSPEAYQRRAAEIKNKTVDIKGIKFGTNNRSIDEIIKTLQDEDYRKQQEQEYLKVQNKFKPIEHDVLNSDSTVLGFNNVTGGYQQSIDTTGLETSLEKVSKQLEAALANLNTSGSDLAFNKLDTTNELLSKLLDNSNLQYEELVKLSSVNIYQDKLESITAEEKEENSKTEAIKRSFFDKLKETDYKSLFNNGMEALLNKNPLMLGGLLGGLGAMAVANPKAALFMSIGAGAATIYSKLKNKANGSMPSDDEDIYVEGEQEPILESVKLKAGEYYDLISKKLITTWGDITGTVVDIKGRVIATTTTLKQRLMTIDGKAIVLNGLDKAKAALIKAFNFLDPVTRAKKLLGKVSDKIYQQDVYIAGQDEVALKGTGFKNGQYYKLVAGELVKLHGFNDIDGPVYDEAGNTLITQTEFETGLVTASGMKVNTIKTGIGSLITGGRVLLGRFGNKVGDKLENAKDKLPTGNGKLIASVDRIYNLLVSHFGYTGTDFDIFSNKVNKAIDEGIVTGKIKPKVTTRNKPRLNSIEYKEQEQVKEEESKSRGALIKLSDWFTGQDDDSKKPKKKRSFLSMLTSGLGLMLMPFGKALSVAGGVGKALLGGIKFLPSIASGIYGIGQAIVGVLSGLMSGKGALNAISASAQAGAAMADSIGNIPTTKGTTAKGNKPSLIKGLFKTNNKLFGAAFKQAGRSGRAAKAVLGAGVKGAKWLGSLGGGAVGRLGLGMTAAGIGGAASLISSGLRASHSVEPGGIGDTILSGLDTAGTVLGTVGTIDTMLAMAGSSVSLTGMGMSALGGVAPFIFNPITLGALAVGAVGYMAYSYYSKGKGEQLPLRLAQYGLKDADNDFANKVIEFERSLTNYVVISGETAKFADSAPVEKLIAPLINNAVNEQFKQNIILWFNYRFKPVFLMTHSAFKTAGFESLEKYDAATGAEVYQVAKSVHDSMGQFEPHPYTVSFTFDEKLRLLDKAQTIEKVNDHLQNISKYAKRHDGGKEEIMEKIDPKLKDSKALEQQLKQSEEKGNWFTDSKGNLGIWDRYKQRNALEDIKESDAKLPEQIDISDMIPTNGIIEPITSLRLAAYGNDKDIPWKCQVVLKLERWCEKYLSNTGNGIKLNVKTEDVYNAFKQSFDADGWFDSDRWVEWFDNRFLPVLKTWFNYCQKIRNGLPSKVWRSLTASNAFEFGRELAELTVVFNDRQMSVWDVRTSPFSSFEISAPFVAKGKDVLKALEYNARDAKLKDPKTEKVRSQPSNVADTKKLLEQRKGNVKDNSGVIDATKTAIPGISKGDMFTNTDNTYRTFTDYGAGDSAFDKYSNVMSNIKEPPPLKNVNQQMAERALYEAAVAHGLQGKELAMFMAQCAEESGNFTTFVENTKYSPSNMVKIWPNRFPTLEAAKSLHSKGEQAVINNIYGGRNGNRPGTSDGWDYRGRGYIQITGRDNYAAAARAIGDPKIIQHPELVGSDLKLSAEASLGWWLANKRARATAQAGDIKANTKVVNGGQTNFEKRMSFYNKYLKLVESGNLDKMMNMGGSPLQGDAGVDTSVDKASVVLDARRGAVEDSKSINTQPMDNSTVENKGSLNQSKAVNDSTISTSAGPVPSQATNTDNGVATVPSPIVPPTVTKSNNTATPVTQATTLNLPPEMVQQNQAMLSLLQQINETLANNNKPQLSKVSI